MRQIEIELEREGKFIASLLDDVAPKTCTILWNNLPLEGLATQARYSGAEFYFGTNLKIEQENQKTNFSAGDIAFNTEPKEPNLLIYYGNNLHILYPYNHLAKIENQYRGTGWPLSELQAAGERIWKKGQEMIYVRRKV